MTIPASSISYFDLDTEKYKTLKTGDESIQVIEDKNFISSTEPLNENQSSDSEKKSELRPSQNVASSDTIFSKKLFWGAVSVPFLFAFLFIFVSKRKVSNEDSIVLKQDLKKLYNEVNQHLESAESALNEGDSEVFFIEVEMTLKKSLSIEMKQSEHQSFSKQDVFSYLKEHHSEALLAKVQLIFNECEQFRYGNGLTNQNKEFIFIQLSAILKSIKG